MSNGITTTVATEIDWYTLGQHLASELSTEQAAFLDGFASGVHGLGVVSAAHQIQYIANGVHGHTGWLVEALGEALNG